MIADWINASYACKETAIVLAVVVGIDSAIVNMVVSCMTAVATVVDLTQYY